MTSLINPQVVIFPIDDFWVSIYFSESEGDDAFNIINEAKNRGKPIGGKYTAILHGPHTSMGQNHLHIYAKIINSLQLTKMELLMTKAIKLQFQIKQQME